MARKSKLRDVWFWMFLELGLDCGFEPTEIFWGFHLTYSKHELNYLVNKLNQMACGKARFTLVNGVLSCQRLAHNSTVDELYRLAG